MNTTIKLGVAGALAFGAVAAHASIASPASGSSDAILFAEVVNTTTSAVVASYAGDTGVSINALVSGSLTGTTTALLNDNNLAKLFAADAAGDELVWAVQGGQYTGNITAANFGVKGNAQFITTSVADGTGKLALDETTNLLHWANLNADISQINLNAGGAASVEGASTAGAGIWDTNTPSGVSGWYSNGPVTGNIQGGTQALFYVTGNGTSNLAHVSYSTLGTTADLTATGLILTGPGGGGTTTTPLPAAVWLLGSGLFGLAGVARRKLKV
jgi:hypothetical protein